MAGRDSTERNPLSPYYPSDTPPVPGNGRRIVALLLVVLLLSGVLFWVADLLVSLVV